LNWKRLHERSTVQYGSLIAQTGNNTPNNYLYCGQQWDPDMGQYYLRQRTFNPNTGRFWTVDTYQGNRYDSLSLHKYLYCHANPINLSDPSGLSPYGHHLVPRAIWKNLSKRVQDIWDASKNRLDAPDYNSHNAKTYNGVTRSDYQNAVQDELDDFLKTKGKTSPEQLTDDELQDFANQIRNTKNGPIGEYNAGVEAEIGEAEGVGEADAEVRGAQREIAEVEEVDAESTTGIAAEDSSLGAP
jgi:RHS repeat-associated protein